MLNINSQYVQDRIVDLFMTDLCNNFFVEIGSYDPIVFNNTYYLEKERGWEGICIEPNPYLYQNINKNRRALSLNIGMSDKKESLDFICAGPLSSIKETISEDFWARIEKDKIHCEEKVIQCFPFSYLYQYINDSEISYLSIDVEGHELKILESIDFGKIKINFITVEYDIVGYDVLREILNKNGFRILFKHHCDLFCINEKLYNSIPLYIKIKKNIIAKSYFIFNDLEIGFKRILKLIRLS